MRIDEITGQDKTLLAIKQISYDFSYEMREIRKLIKELSTVTDKNINIYSDLITYTYDLISNTRKDITILLRSNILNNTDPLLIQANKNLKNLNILEQNLNKL